MIHKLLDYRLKVTPPIYTIQDLLLLLRAPGFYFDMFVGGLIVIAAVTNVVIRKRI